MAIRKSVSALTTDEKRNYVNGVKALKSKFRNPGDPLTIFDSFVNLHANNRGGAHAGPAFLPWHREFLLRLELDLQEEVGSDFGLPYWDWAADAVLADPTDPLQASIWRNDFMGGDGDPINRGPFVPSEWTTTDGNGELKRGFGTRAEMATQTHVNATRDVARYDSSPFHATSSGGPSFRKQLEGFIGTSSGMHNGMHVWVGGSTGQMSFVPISPNDPVFWLHHSNVDRLWAQWEACRPATVDPYLPTSGANPGHNLTDFMIPFEDPANAHPRRPLRVTPQDVLNINNLQDTTGTDISYSYDTFHRRFVTLRRTTGDRFVSDPVIEIRLDCDTQNDNSSTISLPATAGGMIRARFVRVESGAATGDVTEVETVTDEVNVT